jgi:hypothetical protein
MYEMPKEVIQARADAKKIFGFSCECWLSLNTGPEGQCEKCGKPLPVTAEHWRNIALKLQEVLTKP